MKVLKKCKVCGKLIDYFKGLKESICIDCKNWANDLINIELDKTLIDIYNYFSVLEYRLEKLNKMREVCANTDKLYVELGSISRVRHVINKAMTVIDNIDCL